MFSEWMDKTTALQVQANSALVRPSSLVGAASNQSNRRLVQPHRNESIPSSSYRREVDEDEDDENDFNVLDEDEEEGN